MATLRTHARIARPADEVWKVVSDPAGIQAWFPGIESASFADGVRTCSLGGGMELVEDVVTSDDALRRFQYSITGGMPVTSHLGTIDVLEDGDGSLVVYSTEIAPEEMAGLVGPAVEGGLQGLKSHLES